MTKGHTTNRPDDGERGATGVVLSIVERPQGKASLVFDDVRQVGAALPAQWSAQTFFTRVEFDLKDLVESDLNGDDFARIGELIVARLAALRNTQKS